VVVDGYRYLAGLVSGYLNLTPNVVIISCNQAETLLKSISPQNLRSRQQTLTQKCRRFVMTIRHASMPRQLSVSPQITRNEITNASHLFLYLLHSYKQSFKLYLYPILPV
jgi:hypothetical protein